MKLRMFYQQKYCRTFRVQMKVLQRSFCLSTYSGNCTDRIENLVSCMGCSMTAFFAVVDIVHVRCVFDLGHSIPFIGNMTTPYARMLVQIIMIIYSKVIKLAGARE